MENSILGAINEDEKVVKTAYHSPNVSKDGTNGEEKGFELYEHYASNSEC